MYTKGLVWQFAGGKADMWLNNYGASYNVNYVHKGEVVSAQWMVYNGHYQDAVFTEPLGRNIFAAYSNADVSSHTIGTSFPSIVGRSSYLYMTNVNLHQGVHYYFDKGTQFAYIYPKQFLSDNKNEVYSNEQSAIYR